MDPCVWTRLLFKDFRDVLYLYLQNKDSCKYYTGYRELPGAPPACLRRDDTLAHLIRMSFCVSLLWYLYVQNKDSCKYYTGYRELPGAPWQSLGLGRVSISAKNSNSRASLHCYSCQGSISEHITGLSWPTIIPLKMCLSLLLRDGELFYSGNPSEFKNNINHYKTERASFMAAKFPYMGLDGEWKRLRWVK